MVSEKPCYVCSRPLGNETFTFTSKGGVHFTCYVGEVRSSGPGSLSGNVLNLLLDSLKEKLDGIVVYKNRVAKADNAETAKFLQQIEREEEKHAAELTKIIERRFETQK
ncbi:MAG: DUF2175 family protein [Candidatus Bathyarchaeia archaeon]